jgi:hypothetical protein
MASDVGGLAIEEIAVAAAVLSQNLASYIRRRPVVGEIARETLDRKRSLNR